MAPSIDISSKKKVAFICSGGAVKAAAFHAGVAMALERKGFLFHGGMLGAANFDQPYVAGKSISVYAGSSAGSLITTFLAQGGTLSELVSAFRENPSDTGIPGLRYREMLRPRVTTDASSWIGLDTWWLRWLKNPALKSPFSTEGIRKYLHEHMIKSEKFSDLQADLFIVACELDRSRKVVFGKYKSARITSNLEYRNDVAVSDACAASMALPPIYHPYPIQIEGKTRYYFDGEIREPLSSHIGLDIGCDLIICSYTHQPLDLSNKDYSLADKGLQAIVVQALYQAIEQKIQAARGYRAEEKQLFDTIHSFFKRKGLDASLEEELLKEIDSRMSYRSHVDYLYIHPRPSDDEAFFMPHFSLKRGNTEDIVRRGFLAGMFNLRSVKF